MKKSMDRKWLKAQAAAQSTVKADTVSCPDHRIGMLVDPLIAGPAGASIPPKAPASF